MTDSWHTSREPASATPPQPPSWAPPPGSQYPGLQPPEGARSSRRGLWMLVAAVAAMVVAVGGFTLTRSDGEEGGAPVSTVRRYREAVFSLDCDRMVALTTDEFWLDDAILPDEQPIDVCHRVIAMDPPNLAEITVDQVDLVSNDGDLAQVRIAGMDDGERWQADMELQLVGDEWKIDDVQSVVV